MYTNCEYFNWNLKDSAADSKLKLLKDGEVFGEEKPGGEKRIHIGSSANRAKFDSFFFPTNEDKVLFEFSKSDLLLYMIDARDEYMHPKQKYRLDISHFYDDLLKETLSIEAETLYVRFETNIDKRYYLARPKGDEFYTNYNFISKICLPYVTEFVFIRAVDETGVYHFFLKPKFVKVSPSAEGIQADVVNKYKENTGSTSQKIYYGCPGTGKSFTIKLDTEGENGEKVIWYNKATKEDKACARFEGTPSDDEKKSLTNNIFRTTFHPDYDYATFVGCYKPVKNPDEGLDYKFVPQVFTNAYICALRHPEDPVYLIIEEINRGNCAQIFGDLFQLLDRTNGVSDYEIKPDTELAKYLASEGIPSETLCLPDNLHIYATMNTSDQSLFPMDSAFKRRWAMEYKPIDYNQKKASKFTFDIAGEEHSWIKFLKKVNDLILDATDSEDKQMGEFFIKGNVTEKEFTNKVMFYLWNDVCKDLYNPRRVQAPYFLRVAEKLETEKNDYFTFAELFSERNKDSRLLKQFLAYVDKKYEENHPELSKAAEAAVPTE